MARTVSVKDFQKQSSGFDPLAELQTSAAQAGPVLDQLTGQMVAKPQRATDVMTEAAEEVSTRLRALDVRRQCDTETALGLIRDMVRRAADDAGVLADVDAINAEAERIWTSFGQSRIAGSDAARPHEYDVEPNGTVAEVRPAEMTPDRGPDVGTTVHTGPDWREQVRNRAAGLSDDDVTVSAETSGDPFGEPRFSGAGASDDEDLPFTDPSRLIPNDGAFLNERHKAAPELANLADKLIEEHGFFEVLNRCRIDYKWRRKGTNANGKRSIGKLERVSGIWSAYVPYTFVVWLAADTARLAGFTDRQVEAALFHQLAHIAQDAKGNWIRVGHDFEGFGAEVRLYGPWTEDLKIGSTAFTAAVQLGFDLDASEADDFDSDDDPDDYDDTDDLIESDTADDVAAFDAEALTAGELPDDDDLADRDV